MSKQDALYAKQKYNEVHFLKAKDKQLKIITCQNHQTCKQTKVIDNTSNSWCNRTLNFESVMIRRDKKIGGRLKYLPAGAFNIMVLYVCNCEATVSSSMLRDWRYTCSACSGSGGFLSRSWRLLNTSRSHPFLNLPNSTEDSFFVSEGMRKVTDVAQFCQPGIPLAF